MPRPSANASTFNIPPLIVFLIAVATLYFARQLLIPLALALLCAFLLSPFVKRLELWHIPRVPAVLFVLLAAVGALGGLGWVVTNQLVEIVNSLPRYRDNIDRKMAAVRAPGSVSKLLQSIESVTKELTVTPPTVAVPAPRTPAKSARNAPAPADAASASPQKVELVEPPPSALQSVRNYLGPLLGPLEIAGVVIVFTIFMLIDREDLRNRLLGLIGQRQLHRTTKALDDAARRVSRYLMLQFLVNTAFGAVVALALFLIGLDSYLLWGVLAMLLRFVPYVGVIIAWALPFALSLATMDGWRGPAMVLGVFLLVELVTGNLIEPMLYGSHTGLSAVAILTAVIFWTALWGPVGLILSTPLTVCLSVLGRYSPHLQFLNVLLGDEPVLTPDALFYQRLLALDQHDALSQIEAFLKEKPLVEVYDKVIVPALAMAERDRHGGQLEARREEFVIQSIREIISESAESNLVKKSAHPAAKKENRLICLSASDAADEIAGAMFAQIAEQDGYPALSFPPIDDAPELLAGLALQEGDVVCISAVPPLALTHARKVGQAIHEAFPNVSMVIGLWCYPSTTSATVERLQELTGSRVETTLEGALAQLRSVAS